MTRNNAGTTDMMLPVQFRRRGLFSGTEVVLCHLQSWLSKEREAECERERSSIDIFSTRRGKAIQLGAQRKPISTYRK